MVTYRWFTTNNASFGGNMSVNVHGVIVEALTRAAQKLHELEDGGRVEQEGVAYGDANSDTEIKADRVLGQIIRHTILESGDAARVTIEGLGECTSNGKLWYAVDPLDGSLNYKGRVPYWDGFPYTACITVLEKTEGAKFGHVRHAAVANLRRAPLLDMVHADIRYDMDGDWDESRHHPSNVPLRTGRETKLDLGSQEVIGEMYYPENRELLARMFAGKKGWLRNPGSAAYEMTLVATGQAVAYICDRQKQHELGAGYLLVKGAGGVAVDFDGKDLGTREYDFKTQLPVVLAANQEIADQVLELIRKNK